MDVDWALALALARRLDALTQPDLRVLSWAAESAILMGPPATVGGVVVKTASFEGSPVMFADTALSNVQECMIEEVAKGGWPPINPARPNERQAGDRLPAPGVVLDDGEMRLWYGPRESPSLLLPSITEDDLRSLREEGAHGDDGLIEDLWGSWIGLVRRR